MGCPSRIDPDRIDLSKIAYETDVLIIGGGGAGTSAALLAQENGARVIIATKLRHGDANTMMAEGGIQVASQPGKDSPYFHYLDTIGGGHFANVPQLVYTLVTEAPSALQWLEKLGAMLDKNPDGSFKVFHLGGTCRKRVHVAGNSLLDVLVFGKIAGKNAALYAKEKAKDGRLTLDHVRKFHQELLEAGVDRKRVSPILLPDYSNPLVREKQLTTYYQGTMR